MHQGGFTLNDWESVCKFGALEEATSSPWEGPLYWDNSEHVLWPCTEIVSKGNSYLMLMAGTGFPY